MAPTSGRETASAPALDARIEALRRRAYLAAFAGRAARLCAGALVLAGCAALVVRVGLGLEGWLAYVGFGALVAVPVLAHRAARRTVPSRASAAAWLDAHGSADGALVTAFELGAGGPWAERAEERARTAPQPPPLDRRALLRPWPAALLFALACPLVPVARPQAPSATGAQALLEAAVERAREELRVLEEEVGLDEATRAELRDRLERLEVQSATAGLEQGFEGVEALERELERLAAEGADDAARAQEALLAAAAASSGGREAAARATEDAREALRGSPLARGASDDLLQRLERLAQEARDLLGEGTVAELEDLERWLEWMERWSAAEAALREEVEAGLERLAESGLLSPDDLEAAREGLASAETAALEELARELASALSDLELSEERAAELREALSGLPPAPELSPELEAALSELERRIQQELGGVEVPPGPDLERLLSEVDPALRQELLDALADLERRRTEAMERAIQLDPEAFGLDEQQLEALRRAFEALRGELVDWMAGELEPTADAAREALANALARAAERGGSSPLDEAARELLGRALEDLASVDPRALAEALAAVPPELRRALLERLAEEFAAARDGRAAEDAPAAGLDPDAAGEMAEALARLAEGLPAVEPPALTEDEVRRAVEALRAMDPGRPGCGVP